MNPKHLTIGWRSTAFWVNNLVVVSMALSVLAKHSTPHMGAYVVASSTVAYMLAQGIRKLADTEVAKGWKTSEFAAGVLALVIGILTVLKGVLPQNEAAICGSLITAAFFISQGMAQYGTSPSALVSMALPLLQSAKSPLMPAAYAPSPSAPLVSEVALPEPEAGCFSTALGQSEVSA